MNLMSEDDKAADSKEWHKPDMGSDRPKSRFRFKEKRKSDIDHDDDRSHLESTATDGRERFRDHHRSRRSKRSKRSSTKNDPTLDDDTFLLTADSERYMDPETAFRESLFDAMADDEGAQFWEGVYGQPIHTYSKEKVGSTGELEQMNDDEYAQYVRSKMYEKTHQALFEEKARREQIKKEREQRAEEGRRAEREAERFRAEVKASLKRGEERKKQLSWKARWDAYIAKWNSLGKGTSGTVSIASVPWPVESGRQKDVDTEEVEKFFLHAASGGRTTEMQLSKVLKSERVRWHPDKIQQRFGGQDLGENILQAVTAVFQIIDKMWSDVREGRR